MKIYYFFGILLGFIVVWLLLFKPFEVDVQAASEAQIQFQNFEFKSLVRDGIQMQLRGREGIKRGEVLVVKDVQAQRDGEKIEAKEAKYDEFALQLRGDVGYYGKDFRFFSQKVNYFLQSKIVQVPMSFKLQAKDMDVKGSKLLYNQKLGKIVAYDIEAKLKS